MSLPHSATFRGSLLAKEWHQIASYSHPKAFTVRPHRFPLNAAHPVLQPSRLSALSLDAASLPPFFKPTPPLNWNSQTRFCISHLAFVLLAFCFCPPGCHFLREALQEHRPPPLGSSTPSTDRCSLLACFLLLCLEQAASFLHLCFSCSQLLPVLPPTHTCMIWAHPAGNIDVRKEQGEQVLQRRRKFSLPFVWNSLAFVL